MKRSFRVVFVTGFVLAMGACSDSQPARRPEEPGSSPTDVSVATSSPASTAVSTPELDIESQRWRVGNTLELGSGPGQLNVELYIEQGCTGCDGPPVTLERIWRDETGAMRREVVFRTPESSRYLTSTAMSGDGTLYTTACFGECAEVGSFIRSGYTAIYRSRDRGATWVEVERSPAARKFISAALPDGQLIEMRREPHSGTGDPPPATYWTYPGNMELVPPLAGTYPVATANAAEPILWSEFQTGTVYRPNGEEVAVPSFGADNGNGTPRTFGTQPPSGVHLVWLDTRDGLRDWHYTAVQDGELTHDFVGEDTTGAPWVQVWMDAGLALGRMNYSVAALFDFGTATIHPIRLYDPVPSDPFIGRNRIVGFRSVASP